MRDPRIGRALSRIPHSFRLSFASVASRAAGTMLPQRFIRRLLERRRPPREGSIPEAVDRDLFENGRSKGALGLRAGA
jgi:hypothetical protein